MSYAFSWRPIFNEIDLTGVFLMCRAAVPLMKRGGWGAYRQYRVTRRAHAFADDARPLCRLDRRAHRLLARTPVGRVGRPDDVAAAVAFLTSDSATFTSGAIPDVTGGAYMP